MVYTMSDLHGDYDAYRQMLEKIGFGAEDTLYILGDICDRGPDTAKLYLDIMSRKNVFCIRGNHEDMLLEALPLTFGYLDSFKEVDLEAYYSAAVWYACGGETTRFSFLSLNEAQVSAIYRFINRLPYYREITVGGTDFLLVHAGLGGFEPDKPLSAYTAEELVWDSPDFDETFWSGKEKYLIVGHTPTFLIPPDKQAKIYRGKGNVIVIDCGSVFREEGGRLGCLCLDTMEEFYV